MFRGRWWLAFILAGVMFCGACEGSRNPGKIPPAEPGPVFILGFDGLDPRWTEEYERQGLLPNFARLRKEGAVGNIRSTLPFLSPPAWTTVATGVPPADHGIWSFWISTPGAPRGLYVDARARLAPPFWEDLTRAGRTVGIINVPLTSPADSVNGFMISGLPYPEGVALTWPPELEKEITAKGYPRDVLTGPPAAGGEEEWLDQVQAAAESRRKIGLDLLFKQRPDVSMIVFTNPDRIQHHLWRFHDSQHPLHPPESSEKLKNAVRDVYVWCDGVLGEVLDRLAPEQTLLVLSDHGFGPAYRGISKANVAASLPGELSKKNPRGVSVFGGEFYLDFSTPEERRVLVEFLEGLTDGAGNKLVSDAHDLVTDDLRGHGIPLGPAVFAEEAEGFMFYPGAPGDSLVSVLNPLAFSGYHRRIGYFGAWGHPIAPGPLREFDLQDVPAIVLHILGEKVPRRYIHNVPRRLFPDAYFVERPMTFTGAPNEGLRTPGKPGPGTESDMGIREQLEALGYVQ
jgi:hypothetical protein